MIRLSVINHNTRIRFGLSFKEYVFLDMILSETLYKEDIPKIAEFLVITKKRMNNLVKGLKSKGVLMEYENGRIYPSQGFIDSAYGI